MKETFPRKKEGELESVARLKTLRAKVDELNDQWMSQPETEEKARIWNQLEKAQKEYRKLEEELDTRPKISKFEEKYLKLKALKEKIKELNDRWKSEMQREEKAILWSQLRKAQNEADQLEEELDKASEEGNKKKTSKEDTETKDATDPDGAKPKPTVQETLKTPEEKNKEENARKILIILIEKSKSGDLESINILITFIINQIKIEWLTVEQKEWVDKIMILWVEYERVKNSGDITIINNSITNIVNIINNTINIWIINPPQQPPQPPIAPPQPPVAPGSVDDARDLYLKAKRLRGNVFRGMFGRLFGRKLNFGTEEMDFGGKKGATDLEKVRDDYQQKLEQYRTAEIATLQTSIDARIAAGTLTPAQATLEFHDKIIALLRQEDTNIDNKAMNGIEKNTFEKMKTWWRQNPGKRLGIGAGLLGLSFLTAGTSAAAGVLGTRAVLGGVGIYVGVESALEKYGKTLGHVGLVNEIGKKGALFVTPAALDTHIASLPDDEIKKEAARLRMLQVEKGIALGNLYKDNNSRIAMAILNRDNELMANEAIRNAHLQNPALGFANMLSSRLALQIDTMNETVESQTDKERVKKMFRKTTAALAGGAVGWIIGGSLFHHPDTTPIPPGHGPLDSSPNLHTVTSGENTWKIIESKLNAKDAMDGLTTGVGGQTHMIDTLKDQLAILPAAALKELGWLSGNINIINPGDVLDMSGIMNTHSILNAFSNADSISSSMATSIVENNDTIASWLATHSGSALNDAVIEKILKGSI